MGQFIKERGAFNTKLLQKSKSFGSGIVKVWNKIWNWGRISPQQCEKHITSYRKLSNQVHKGPDKLGYSFSLNKCKKKQLFLFFHSMYCHCCGYRIYDHIDKGGVCSHSVQCAAYQRQCVKKSVPFICFLAQMNVGVSSLECTSVVFACLPAPSGPRFFCTLHECAWGESRGRTEQEIKARRKQSPCLVSDNDKHNEDPLRLSLSFPHYEHSSFEICHHATYPWHSHLFIREKKKNLNHTRTT